VPPSRDNHGTHHKSRIVLGSFAGSPNLQTPNFGDPQNFSTRNFGTLPAKQITCVFFGFTPTGRSFPTENVITVPIRIG